MSHRYFYCFILLLSLSCKSAKISQEQPNSDKKLVQTLKDDNTFVVPEMATDKTYGYSPDNAVEVGGALDRVGPLNERRYLNALAGPNGEKLSYFRAGSCCPVKSENGMMGLAMLDNYRVFWEGAKDTLSIYINMYDSSVLKVPVGLRLKD